MVLGNSREDHRKKGHTISPRYEMVTRNGKKVQQVKRWVCSCGRTFRA